MSRHLKKFDQSGPNARFMAALNAMVEEINRLSAIRDPGSLTEETTDGVRTRPKNLGTGSGSSQDPRWG